jgi:hypothetical protein
MLAEIGQPQTKATGELYQQEIYCKSQFLHNVLFGCADKPAEKHY